MARGPIVSFYSDILAQTIIFLIKIIMVGRVNKVQQI